jgi:TetR/AcrR family transcriptional regulator
MRTRTQELSQEKEALILNAAQKRFAFYGMSKSTMDEIAADVGLAKASLYYYFPTKEDLFRRVIEREQRIYLEEIEQLLTFELSGREMLRRYASKRTNYFKEHFNLSALNFNAWMEMKPIFGNMMQQFASEEERIVQGILQIGIQRGEFKSNLPNETARIILHVLHGLRLRVLKRVEMTRDMNVNLEELSQDMSRFIELLITGLEAH